MPNQNGHSSSQLAEVNKNHPCPHCSKTDWCYQLGELTVCKRTAEPATGWEKTSKSDKDGTFYYAPAQPQKSLRPKSKKEFHYADRDGNPLIKVTRTDDGQGVRKFFQSHWNGQGWVVGLSEEIIPQIPIYRYQQVRKAIAAGKPIFMVEGEGCADALWNIGLTATTTLGGSSKYRSYGSYSEDLAGANLILCPDRDKLGMLHMEQIAEDFPDAQWLYAPPSEFFWNNLPPSHGLDVADWIADNHLAADDILADVVDRRSPPQQNTTKPSSTAIRPNLQKTIGELESEIFTAVTGSNAKLALTQVAAANGFPVEFVEHLATSLLRDQGLDEQYDLQKTEYMNYIDQVRDLELKIADPGERCWKMQALARRYRRSEAQLRESYCKSLIAQHLAEPVTLASLKEQYGENQEWVLRGWIPKSSLVLLHAQGGIGKTLFTQHLIRHIATGSDWEEYKVSNSKGQSILYIQSDTSPLNLIESLKQGGITDNLPIKYHVSWQMDYVHQMYGWIKRDRPSLVVIDSLTSVSRFSVLSENETEYARPILLMGDIARELNCSFLIIHHSNSDNQARGTKAVRNAVDEVWRLEAVDPKNPCNVERILAMEKSRSRAPMRYKLKFNEDDYSWECLGFDQGDDAPPVNTSARWLIINHMYKNPGIRFTAPDLAEALIISENTLRKELPGLFREGLVDREPNPNFKKGSQGKQEFKHFYLINSRNP